MTDKILFVRESNEWGGMKMYDVFYASGATRSYNGPEHLPEDVISFMETSTVRCSSDLYRAVSIYE